MKKTLLSAFLIVAAGLAFAQEKVQDFRLPMGIVKRRISGERTLLLGDAAGLIDPFSGE